ncbi:MAG: class I SAM-dependent methyltransferase, partial [Anaerolineales bacterium]|nr:class I SAM-dependent methyltransferase [Anaerolineales bacterium]
DNTFDLVTCRIAPHHFVDCLCFVRQGSRVLKRGGVLLVQDHVLPENEQSARYVDAFERLRDPSHNRAFSRSAWVGKFAAAGLAVEQVEEVPKRHALLPWAQRQGCSPEAISELRRRLDEAPPIAAGWFQAEQVEGPNSSFVNHHILISGRK